MIIKHQAPFHFLTFLEYLVWLRGPMVRSLMRSVLSSNIVSKPVPVSVVKGAVSVQASLVSTPRLVRWAKKIALGRLFFL